MKLWILVFFGGGVGSLCRYLLSRWMTGNVISAFPYGTFLVNVSGCLLIGFLFFILPRRASGLIHLHGAYCW